ncbi:MAG: ABC transporter substrate-binding protein [Spirochaetota bacterium]|nr:ABC transporter substrate-binding protein [Spirochaetota bacterium]
MKEKSKVLSLLFFSVSIFFLNSSNTKAKEVRGVSENLVKIGLSMDQTGPAASTLVPLTNAVRNLARHVNEIGGINGRKLKIIVEDDRYSIPPAIAAIKKLVYKDKIFALIGPSSASLINVIWKHIQKNKLPTIVAPSTEVAVVPYKKYLFIFTETYTGQAKILVNYMINDYKMKKRRIGLVYPDTETGKTDLRAVLPKLEQYKIKPVTSQILMPGALDATSQVLNLKRNRVNCILNIGTIPPTSVTLLRELMKFGLKIPVFQTYGAMLGEELAQMGKIAENTYIVHAISPWYGEGAGVAEMRKITLKYHPGTEKPYRGTAYTGGWALESALVIGMKKAGRDLNCNTLIKALETFKDYDNGGLCGIINYSPTSHKGGDTARIFKVDTNSKKYVAITGWLKAE